MTKNKNSKPYDLEDRTLEFARNVRSFIKKLPKTIANGLVKSQRTPSPLKGEGWGEGE